MARTPIETLTGASYSVAWTPGQSPPSRPHESEGSFLQPIAELSHALWGWARNLHVRSLKVTFLVNIAT